MLKNIIAPLQSWLLNQKRCVGCGMPLSKAQNTKKSGLETKTCKCKRVYVYDDKTKGYRRALLNEV